MITTAPPAGYEYAVIQTIDTNTHEQVWIVYAKPVWYREYWRSILGTASTAIIGIMGWVFKSELSQLLFKKAE